MVLAAALVLNGCAGAYNQDTGKPRSIYTATDSTALVYSDPPAAAPVEDLIFWRWAAVVLHPFGVLLDYAVNRPFYAVAAHSPGMFGYTVEDEQLDSQRTMLQSYDR
jgi:hypothetical protein